MLNHALEWVSEYRIHSIRTYPTVPLHFVLWLNGLVVSALEIRARGPGFDSQVVPLGSNLGQVVYSHFLRAEKHGFKEGVFGVFSGYGD